MLCHLKTVYNNLIRGNSTNSSKNTIGWPIKRTLREHLKHDADSIPKIALTLPLGSGWPWALRVRCRVTTPVTRVLPGVGKPRGSRQILDRKVARLAPVRRRRRSTNTDRVGSGGFKLEGLVDHWPRGPPLLCRFQLPQQAYSRNSWASPYVLYGLYLPYRVWGWLGSRVVSVLDSGTERFKSQSRRCRVTVLGKLFTPIVPLFTKQQNW